MFGLFQNRERTASVGRIYGDILTQARHPAFFTDHGVADTVEGRYDMMVLHVFLVLQRLFQEDADVRQLAQEVCDRFFTEMDRALREMGVGDLGVPKKMKKIAQLYAGCARAYSEALAQPGDDALSAALARNVYEDPSGQDDRAPALAAHVRASVALLASARVEDLIKGGVRFADPATTSRSAA
jgi:cytochrome b pre-mRNA-processing protein 3